MKKLLSVLCTVLLAGVVTSAQQAGSSPAGTAELEIGGKWETQTGPNGRERQVDTGGKWITVSYGRPLKRGRELFGTGDAYLIPDGARATFRIVSDEPYLHVCVIMPRFEFSKEERTDSYS